VEPLIVVVVMAVVALVLVSPIVTVFAFVRLAAVRREMDDLGTELRALRGRVERLGRTEPAGSGSADGAATASVPPPPVRVPSSAMPPPFPSGVAGTPVRVPAAPAAALATPSTPPPRPPTVARPPAGPPPSSGDFAANLGPKILGATGALAFVVFLGLFVKYAWDNDWVGPTGRVLSGAAFGLGLLTAGARMMSGRYRPLGQALSGAGLAGLYSSAFAAHAFYHLIPRTASGALMVIITGCAVLLAARLDARLLAALAWIGGYLTPVLLSTGEDKAIALFLFLTILDAGAVVLDHKKPWPETVPLALMGTVLLYGGWYERFFTPDRFAVAAFGIVLFTALFAVGMAPKERGAGLGAVFVLSGIGLGVLAAGADRPEVLLLLALALGGAAMAEAARRHWGFSVLAAFAMGLPLLTWLGSFYRPEAFGLAAAWVVGAVLVLTLPWIGGAVTPPVALEGAVLIGAGLVSLALCRATDRPEALSLFLLAQAGVAVLVRRRWPWAEAVGVAGAALSGLGWMDVFFRPARASDAYLIALPVAGVYLLALVVRGLVRRAPLSVADVATHLATALFTWTVLYRVLYASQPGRLGFVSVALAVLYLAAGLAALGGPARDVRQPLIHDGGRQRQARVLLGLAAAFLTVAIPVQLGLYGITVAWAVEGVLLLWLGLRFESALARAAAYGVLGLATLRLFVRHLPLHIGPFDPVFNPSFGTWIFVIAALGVAVLLSRDAALEPGTPDRVLRPFLAGVALLLLFGLLTGETSETFRQQASRAADSGDLAAVQEARRVGGLAVSVLWTVFATSLLAAGLGLRSHPLFYSAYALFALTAAKVVFWDLETFSVPYRMLSFLALALLLTAGAYLNLRFRERLARREAA
jgi:uncharacterized membrane protein